MGHQQKSLQKASIGRILFVEDEGAFAEFTVENLRKLQVACDWAKSLEEAKALVSKIQYHAFVVDMFLDGSEEPKGLELIELARTEGVPSIIVTSALNVDIAKTGLNLGADRVIEKPFEAKDLKKNLLTIWENPKSQQGRMERLFELHKLTPKECEVARYMLKALNNEEISKLLGISVVTVKFHTHQIFSKFEVSNRSEFFNAIFHF